MQYPITLSYLFILTLILIACYGHLSYVHALFLWSFITVYNHYFWFIGYTILEKKISKQRDYVLDYGRYLPIWGYTALPYGKGSIYLRKVEAKTKEEFAIAQIKALKLSCWAFLLHILLTYMHHFESYFQIPTLDHALSDYTIGIHYAFYNSWILLLDRFFRMMLELTVTGHLVVATCRLCGFKILRNTYRPLQSATIAEFWNRYNFYFKELMAEFYYYPTYFRFFKNYPRIRIFFAAMAAATFGNILFHFLLITPIMINTNFINACYGFIPFCLYAGVLGISIGFSQLNSNFTKNSNILSKYIISPIFVLGFYAILGLFNQPYQHESVIINFKILASLFNITW
jgi:hypothetical protein